MSGLLQRAKEHLDTQRHLRLVRPGEDELEEFQGTEHERALIEAEIQRAVTESRRQSSGVPPDLTPMRRGSVLPLMVNAVALVLVAGGLIVLLRGFRSRESDLVAQTAVVASAEGQVLDRLRAESQAQLSEKEQEIESIRQRLGALQSERETLRLRADRELAEREATLRAGYEEALAQERARLEGLQLSEQEQAEQLRAFQTAREAAYEQELAAARAEAEAREAAAENALNTVVAGFEAELGRAQSEQTALREALQAREADLVAGFRAREAELQGDRTAALQMLEELQAQQEQRTAALDQILSFYSRVQRAVTAGALDDAQAELASLRTYLDGRLITSLPDLQRRRGVELFLVETLEQQIARTRSIDQVDVGAVAETTRVITEIAGLIAAGHERYLAGDYEAAVDRYGAALATLPASDDELLGRIVDAGYRLRASGSLAELAQLRDELAAAEESSRSLTAAVADRERTVAERDGAISALQARTESLASELGAERDRAGGVAEELARERDRADTVAGELARERAARLDADASLAGTLQLVETLRAAAAEADAGRETAEAQSRRAEAELELLQARLAEHRSVADAVARYQGRFASAAQTWTRVTPLELLETKLLVLRIVNSETVRADHPDLAADLGAYVDALITEQRSDATRRTIAEIGELLTLLAREGTTLIDSARDLTELYPTLAVPALGAEVADLLGRLRNVAAP